MSPRAFVGPAANPEPPLLDYPRRDAVIAAVVAALTAAVFAAAAVGGVLGHVQRVDDAWLRLMISGRNTPVTVIAKAFNVLGLVYVTLPVRLAVIGYLGLRRRWWRLAAFAAAVVISEVLIGQLKDVYHRARPPGSLVATSGASFPSGHSIAASVTVLAMVIALVPPHRRRTGWAIAAVTFAVLMALSRAYLGAHWLSDAVAGVLLGTSCALVAAVVVDRVQRRRGRAERWLGPDGIAAALNQAGLPAGAPGAAGTAGAVVSVRPAGVRAKGSRPFIAETADRRRVFVKALGPGQRRADLLYRAYRAVRLKGVGDRRPAASLRQAVEHQALLALLAERAGVDVPRVHGVALAPGGTALLVMDLVPGISLDLLPPDRITDDLLARVWTAVAGLHKARLAHRSLRAANVVVQEGGRPWLTDFSFAELAASPRQMDLDVAELLASVAALAGPERAVASAAEVIGTAGLAAAVPLLQPMALSAATRRELRARKGLLARTRSAAASRSGSAPEELAGIQRVRPRTLLAVAVAAAVFYLLLPELAKAGGSWQAVLNADWAWLPAVLAASALTYVASAISLAGSVAIRLRFWPTLAVQAASSFVNRISPSNVGGMALNARFLAKSGVEPAAGVTAVGVNALAGALVHLALIAIFFPLAGRRLAGAFKLPSPSKVLLVLAIIAVVVGVILATRRARRFTARAILPRLRSSLANLRQVARRPGKLTLLFGGSALVTLAYIGGLAASVRAFGGPVSVTEIGAVYLATAAIAAASFTPGGVGTFEAVLTAALTGIGIRASVAVPAVITYRLATYWLPVAPGWAAWHVLQRRNLI